MIEYIVGIGAVLLLGWLGHREAERHRRQTIEKLEQRRRKVWRHPSIR